ncbi:MAG: hypothetical protein F9K09_03265 [Flavobacteriales bacterium]|nr:MAG: hypothetical protein F9K09_03265 [Flavobacteriales bacterium]
MRINLLFCFFLMCNSSFSQKITSSEINFYKNYNDYLKDSSFISECSIKRIENKKIVSLKISCKNESFMPVWGMKYEDKVWIEDKNRKRFYELKNDSLGLFYDIFNDEQMNWTTIVGGVSLGIATGVLGGIVFVPYQKPLAGLSDVTLRFRQDTTSNEFYPCEFPYIKQSKVFYCFSKYSKKDTPVEIEINNELISLTKGSYYETTLPSRPPYKTRGVYYRSGSPISYIINVLPAETTVILFSRDEFGEIRQDELNKQMVEDFLLKKEKLKKINP